MILTIISDWIRSQVELEKHNIAKARNFTAIKYLEAK